MRHEDYMREALLLAAEASADGDVPVGCVIADEDGKIIGCGRNRREADKNAICHAEIIAISEACKAKGDWRLNGCSLYVTLEPCPMCAGAIIGARISKVYYGARDENTGSCGSVINLFMENYGFEPNVYGGILERECSEILRDFFGGLRRD